MQLELSRQVFEKKAQIKSVIKINPVGADFLHAVGETEGRTDRHEANTSFS